MNKVCTMCGKELPATEEYYPTYFDKRSNTRKLKANCRKCSAERCRKWREQNQDRYLSYAKEYSHSEKGKESNQRYKENHRQEILNRKKEYRVKNRDKIAEYDKAQWANPETRVKRQGFQKRWRENNKQHISEYQAEWFKSHPNYHPVWKASKRADGDITEETWEQTKSYFDYACAYCGKRGSLTLEHFIPLSAGGLSTIKNCIPACLSCNSSKNNHNFDEWYKKQKFYSPEREKKIRKFIEE